MDIRGRAVLFCSPSYGYGGELMYFRPILAGFAEAFPRSVIPVEAGFPTSRYPEIPLLPVLRFVRGRLGGTRRHGRVHVSTRRVPTLASIIRLARTRADCYVLLEFTPVALTGFVLAAFRRRPTLLLMESHPAFRGAADKAWEVRVKRQVARRVDEILVNNDSAAEYIRTLSPDAATKVTVAPFLTSAHAIPGGEDHRPREDDVVRFLFTGRPSTAKGLPNLLDALALLGEESVGRWTLDVVGTGDEIDAMRARSVDLGLQERVTFRGAVPYEEMGSVYRTADVYVSATLADYRSLASIEAVSAGLPAVLSVHDGAAEELRDGGAAVQVVDPDRPEELARALATYVEEPGLLERMTDKARDCSLDLSPDSAVANLVEAVERAIAGRGDRRRPGRSPARRRSADGRRDR